MKKEHIMRKYYHELFFKLYNPQYIHIGKYWLEKIKRKTHYTYKSMQKTCICEKWFIDNYDTDNLIGLLTVYNNRYEVFIHRKKDDKIVGCFFLKSKNGVYVMESLDSDEIYENIDQCEYLKNEKLKETTDEK